MCPKVALRLLIIIKFTLIIIFFNGCKEDLRSKPENKLSREARYRVEIYGVLVDRYLQYKMKYGKYPKSFAELGEYCPIVNELQSKRLKKSNLQIISIDSDVAIGDGDRSYPLFIETSPDNDGIQLVIFQDREICTLQKIQIPDK